MSLTKAEPPSSSPANPSDIAMKNLRDRIQNDSSISGSIKEAALADLTVGGSNQLGKLKAAIESETDSVTQQNKST